MTRSDFPPEIKLKCLLWSDRHCCLCEKICGTDIEIAHINKNDDIDIDNAIPLCFDCHSKIGHYNKEHPKGNKYRVEELKTRREQVYEKYTKHLVPPINIELLPVYSTNDLNTIRVATKITHNSDQNPIKLILKMKLFIGKEEIGLVNSHYYNGTTIWNINPRITITGNFPISSDLIENKNQLRIETNSTIIDVYERPHPQLPFSFAYVKDGNYWYYEPASMNEIVKTLN
jgi:hypothetical protein